MELVTSHKLNLEWAQVILCGQTCILPSGGIMDLSDLDLPEGWRAKLLLTSIGPRFRGHLCLSHGSSAGWPVCWISLLRELTNRMWNFPETSAQ